MMSFTHKIFVKKLENTFRDYDEKIAHPTTVNYNGKNYEYVHYFKDKITLSNIGECFKNYNIKQLCVEFDITNADIRKLKLKNIFDEE